MLRFPLGMISKEECDRAAEAPWVFCTQYENLSGRRRTGTYKVDFSQFIGMFFDTNWPKEAAQSLDSIQKDLHRLTEGYAKVQVVTQTREQFVRENEDYVRQYEDQIGDDEYGLK